MSRAFLSLASFGEKPVEVVTICGGKLVLWPPNLLQKRVGISAWRLRDRIVHTKVLRAAVGLFDFGFADDWEFGKVSAVFKFLAFEQRGELF
jgi:hypothetical protein